MAACSPIRFAGKISGGVLGAKVASALPAPRAKTIVEPKGGSFCGTMTALGWPLKATPEDKTHIKGLSRPTKEPILAAQLHGQAECQDWK